MTVPALRVRAANDRPLAADGRYVVLWMIGARRTRWNHALDRAVEVAHDLGKPLLVLEALRCGYALGERPAAHAFVLQGMADNAAACARADVAYLPLRRAPRRRGQAACSRRSRPTPAPS